MAEANTQGLPLDDRNTKIGLNGLFLRPGKNGGIETYLKELISAFLSRPDFQFNKIVLFTGREGAAVALPENSRLQIVVLPFSAANQYMRYIAEQVMLPFYIAKYEITILHSLAYVGPLFSGVPHIVTVHDLNFSEPSLRMSILRRTVLGSVCALTCKRADLVIAVSDFTRTQLIKRLRLPVAKVVRVYEAGRQMHVARDETILEAVGSDGYILVLGGRFPNKNIVRLVAAYEKISSEISLNLVIVGGIFLPHKQMIDEAKIRLGPKLKLIPYADDSILKRLLNSAYMYVHPSLYEGFGMPVVEAQNAGTAVVCSNTSALPEIAGRGARYFDPYCIDSIADEMLKTAVDPDIRSQLVLLGRVNALRFSWEVTAAQTFKFYAALTTDLLQGGQRRI